MFTEELKEHLSSSLGQFKTRQLKPTDNKLRAAVAIIVTNLGKGANLNDMPRFSNNQHDAALVLTRRSRKLKRHAGQWSFPGGRIENTETPMSAALRETSEEIGIKLRESDALGYLDDFITRSGFLITPVVFWGRESMPYVMNFEVESIHCIPISEFLRSDSPVLEDTADSERKILKMRVGDDWIAAPTAAMLYQFREVCIFRRNTRVAHFEQPKFAWT